MVRGKVQKKAKVNRRGHRHETIFFRIVHAAYGLALLGASERGVCCVLLGSSAKSLRSQLRSQFGQVNLTPVAALVAAKTRAQVRVVNFLATLTRYLHDAPHKKRLALDLIGTPFQCKVWAALRAIPRGSTRSYAEIAQRIGSPRAVRAVANACAHNKLALVIPCHRVVRSDGTLGGYRWGIERKRRLLQGETLAISL